MLYNTRQQGISTYELYSYIPIFYDNEKINTFFYGQILSNNF